MLKSKFFTHKKAASLTGYALLVGLIAVIAIGAIQRVGGNVSTLFQTVSITVNNAIEGKNTALNLPPPSGTAPSVTGTISNQIAEASTAYAFTFATNIFGGDSLSYTATNLPSWLSFDGGGTVCGKIQITYIL